MLVWMVIGTHRGMGGGGDGGVTCRPLQMVAIYLQSQYGTAILSSLPLQLSVCILT
jgi:hypothetical protein